MSIALDYADSAPSHEQWEVLKPFITDLYQRQQYTARRILLELRNKHNYVITEKMLRDRLSRWKLRKNSAGKAQSVIKLSQSLSSSSMYDSPRHLTNVHTKGTALVNGPHEFMYTFPRSRSHEHPNATSVSRTSDAFAARVVASQEPGVDRPIPTAVADLPRTRLLAAISRWFDGFLETSTCDKWSLSKCTMLDLTDTVQKGFYYVDVGDSSSRRKGFEVLRQVGYLAPGALCSDHPASFIYALRGLGATRRQTSRSSKLEPEPETCRPNVFQDRQPRVIECNGCDDAIVEAHHHCTICYGGHYDLCSDCVAAGIHCLNNDHWLIKRTIDDQGVVTESASDMITACFMRDDVPGRPATRPKQQNQSGKQRSLYVAEPMTSSAVFPEVCIYLLRRARELRGPDHPISLLLETFQHRTDLEILRDHILLIMDVKLAAQLESGGIDPQMTHLEAARNWVLYQQGKHQELEAWFNDYLFEGNNSPRTGAELMDLLATASLEDGQIESASTWLGALGNTLVGVDLESSAQVTKALHDLATVSWHVDDLEECEIALALAYQNLKSARVVSLRSRCFVLTFYKALCLYLRRKRSHGIPVSSDPGRTWPVSVKL